MGRYEYVRRCRDSWLPAQWLAPDRRRKLLFPISETRGQHVRAVFFHRVGPLEYIWFSNGLAFPAILYDWSISFLGSWTTPAIATVKPSMSGRREGWSGFSGRATFMRPEVLANARKHLRGTFRNNTK